MLKIKIDPEFSQLIPSYANGDLETEMVRDGKMIQPLVIWSHQNILLDGHRRHAILKRTPSIKQPKPVVLDLATRQEAHDWIIRHQLSKRNVTDEQRTYLIGKLYLDAKQPVGKAKVDTVSTLESGKTAEKIADAEGVSERTVRRAADFAEAVDDVPSEVKDAVLSGEVKATTKDLEALAELPKRDAAKAAKKIASGEVKSVKAALPGGGKTVKKKPVNELATIDKTIDEYFGKLMRAINARAEVCGGRGPRFAAVDSSMGEVLADWKAWQKAGGR